MIIEVRSTSNLVSVNEITIAWCGEDNRNDIYFINTGVCKLTINGNGNFNRPETIEKSVRVDYFGTILTNQEFTMAHSDINPNDEFVHINKLFKFTYEDEIKGKDVYKYFKDVKI